MKLANKEYILGLWLKKYPEMISRKIGYNVKEILLEKKYGSRIVDGYSLLGNREIFIENQLTNSDEGHVRQIIELIDSIEIGQVSTVIWIAKSFYNSKVEKIIEKIKNTEKHIEFISIEISDESLEMIQHIYSLGSNRAIENLYKLNKIINLKINNKYYDSNNNFVKNSKLKSSKVTEKERITSKIMLEVRKQLYYFANAHRERSFSGNILVFGAGKSDICYGIGVNRKNEIFVELVFQHYTKKFFLDLYNKKHEIDEKFKYSVHWDVDLFKITNKKKYHKNENQVIEAQVRVLGKFIEYFSTYIKNCD